MNKMILGVSAAATMMASSIAAAEISANVAFTNDYRFRGISQTDERFALQGGFDYAHESGIYAGTWASNVDFAGSSELDLYAGYGADISEQVSLDFNVLYFYYPGQNRTAQGADFNYVELTPGISYSGDAVSGSLSVSYSPDFFAESEDGYYYNLGVDIPLTNGIGLGLHAGHQTIDDNAAFGTPDYTDWSVSLSKSFGDLDWSVSYVDTDLDGADCFGGPDDICAAGAVVSVSKSM